MIDQTASTVALARTMLMSVDLAVESTLVRTASLQLVLETLIALGGGLGSPVPNATPGMTADAVRAGAMRTVAGTIATIDLEANPPGGRSAPR